MARAFDPKPVTCDFCPATIFFVEMEVTGRKMPCNPPRTMVVCEGDEHKGRTVKAYEPHWGSCPGAAEARRRAHDPRTGEKPDDD